MKCACTTRTCLCRGFTAYCLLLRVHRVFIPDSVLQGEETGRGGAGVSRRQSPFTHGGCAVYYFYRICEWLASWIPERVAYGLARALGEVLFLMDLRLRETLIANQRRLLPDASESEIVRSARRACLTVAKNYYDLFRLPAMSQGDVRRYFTLIGEEHIRAAVARGKGVIVVAPHLGSFNLVPALACTLGYKVVAVVEHIRDPRLHDYFLHLRKNHGLEVVTNSPQDVRVILRTLREGGIVLMLADRNVGTATDEVVFFGERTHLPAGPGLVARRTGATILPAYSYRTGNGGSVAVALPPLALPTVKGTPEQRRAADTQAITRAIEVGIMRAPDQWAVLQPVWPMAPERSPVFANAAG